MKAGSEGSNPYGVSKQHACATQPLRDFLGAVGESVANLNAIVVGLDAVENGHQKPDTLNISWQPHDRLAAARKARRFIVEAVLIRCETAFNEFIFVVAKLPRLSIVRSRWDGDTSREEKAVSVCQELCASENYRIAGMALLFHWRNRIVHPRSKAALSANLKKLLIDAEIEIETVYSGLSVSRLMQDFDQGRPTLKDVSSLIAMTIKLAREVDDHLCDLNEEDLGILLRHYGLDLRIQKIMSETRPSKVQDSIIRLLQADAPGLVQVYERIGTQSESS